MEIVSHITDSFQEYDGHHSLVLFCKGCNLKCRECYNLENVVSNPTEGEASNLISQLLSPLHDAVVLLGGEPTVWDLSLVNTLSYARGLGMLTKVFTNGVKPEVVSQLNRMGLVNAYSVDVKCVRNCSYILDTEIDDFDYLDRINRTVLDILSHDDIEIELRTTKWNCVEDQMKDIISHVKHSFPNVKHILQDKFVISKPKEESYPSSEVSCT